MQTFKDLKIMCICVSMNKKKFEKNLKDSSNEKFGKKYEEFPNIKLKNYGKSSLKYLAILSKSLSIISK